MNPSIKIQGPRALIDYFCKTYQTLEQIAERQVKRDDQTVTWRNSND